MYRTAPTTMTLSHVLADMQHFRDVVPGLTVPAGRSCSAGSTIGGR